MTDTLTRLRQLHQQATPGPWKAVEKRGWLVAGPPFTDGSMRAEDVCDLEYSERRERQENAVLIAATRNALPYLLAIAEAAEYHDHSEAWGPKPLTIPVPGCRLCEALSALQEKP